MMQAEASYIVETLPAPQGNAGPVACIVGQPFCSTAAAVYSNGSVLLWDVSPEVRILTCPMQWMVSNVPEVYVSLK